MVSWVKTHTSGLSQPWRPGLLLNSLYGNFFFFLKIENPQAIISYHIEVCEIHTPHAMINYTVLTRPLLNSYNAPKKNARVQLQNKGMKLTRRERNVSLFLTRNLVLTPRKSPRGAGECGSLTPKGSTLDLV